MDGLREIENKKLSLAEVVKQSHEQLVRQANELPIELTNITGTYLQYLNDDCLLQIFSVKSLDLLDLCSLAETCARFQPITKRVFPKDLRIKIGIHKNGCWFKTESYSTRRGHDIERIFKIFGSILYEISIQDWRCFSKIYSPWLFVLNLLEYCVGTLKRLKIENLTINEVLTVKFKAIFKRLQKLHINVVVIEDYKTLFADCVSLIELSVKNGPDCSAILEHLFPKLERLTYHQDLEPTKQLLLTTFISRHPSLKMLELRLDCEMQNDTLKNVVEEIGNSCKELEELRMGSLCGNDSFIQALQAVKSLKTLKLWNVECNDFEFIPALTNLRELHFLHCSLPEDFKQFAFLTQLTKMHVLYSELGSFDVLEIIRRLKNLEEITIMDRYALDEKTFSKIVAVVEGRPKVLTLKCCFHFKNCDENQNVRLVPLYDD